MQIICAPRALCPPPLRGSPRRRDSLITTCAIPNSRHSLDRRELMTGSAALAASTLLLNGSNPALAAGGADSIYSFSGTLDVPCNQFGGQSPGTDQEERDAAYRKFGLDTFPVVDHMLTNGRDAHPLYRYMKSEQPIELPSSQGAPPGEKGVLTWNYVKFLIDRNGKPVKRFKPGFDPMEFEGDVRLLLAGKDPLPAECIMHPGRKVCNVDRLLSA
ncbi:putative Glutathione peroxidase [Nannochloris sp. 'desiccata']|nr:putative Glutathione peroxidase [Chlorella desiccata (nom. nud.)]KAH7615728.1 putative Glutathione peroxidase [Chlorella desiccata (nom. nud.)]